MIETFKIEENSHRVSPQIDKRFNILCSEERPAGYCHDSEIHTENKDWMKNLSDRNVRITKLSIPGTHDTMAFYGGDAVQCQSLSLETQLNAGIRAIDIRCRHISDVFAIHHGCVYQNANFGDVLNTVARYLDEHPKETILMRVKEEYNEEKCDRTFEETFLFLAEPQSCAHVQDSFFVISLLSFTYIFMSLLPILAAKLDYVFHTAMGRLGFLKHCVSVILWRFARCAFGKSSGKEYMEGRRHLFHHEQEPW